MAVNTKASGGGPGSRWRVVGWGAAAVVLLLPLVAMQFTDEVNWNVADFIFAGLLLAGVGLPFELVVRRTGDHAYRAGAGVGLAAALILVWANGAVGIIGSENNSANQMYGGVLAVAVVGTFIARFRPGGMARTMAATALAQAVVAGIAVVAGLGLPEAGPREIVVVNGFFIVLWVGSAMLFREAAHREVERGGV